MLRRNEYIFIAGVFRDESAVFFDSILRLDPVLGLFLVKKLLIEIQVGKILVESEYGVGTKFIIKFPVRTVDYENSSKNYKLINNTLNNRVEKIKIEFSDIYAI